MATPEAQLSLFGIKLPLRTLLLILIVLLIGACSTAYINKFVRRQSHTIAMERLEKRVDNSMALLGMALLRHESMLRSLQSLYHASQYIDRAEFADFLTSMNLQHPLTSIQAMSWNPVVQVADTDSFEQAVRADTSLRQQGYPDFTVRPESADRPRYVVKFIEPMKGNERAFGFDIGSNDERRNTVELARDTGKAQATAPLTLQQESGDQMGFLLVAPVYQSYTPADLEERRASFRGVVVAVFRIGDLISGSGELDFSSVQAIDVSQEATPEAALTLFTKGAEVADSLTLQRRIPVAGREWELVFTESAGRLQDHHWSVDWAVLGLGSLATLLSAFVLGHLALSEQRARKLADELTFDLKKANQRLKRSNEDLERFAYVASHDLQTPVRNVVSSVTLLEEVIDTHENAEVQEYLGFLKDASSRMRSLINDLLDYSRVSRNELKKTAVNLDDLMAHLRDATALMFADANASLQIDAMPVVQADWQALERVMINLLTNAVQYGRKGVPVAVRVTSSMEDGFFAIRVIDNGQGIPVEFQESVFEPFRRLHRQEEVSGSGLGLSICTQIVERHGGEIRVESTSDSGTVILLLLPVGKPEASSNA